MDWSVCPWNQHAVHQKFHVVHRHGSQQQKDFGHDPTAEIHLDLDLTVSIYYRFIRGIFARSDGPEVIHQVIRRLRMFPTLNRRSFAQFDGQNFIRTQIQWLTFDPTLIRIKTMIFCQIWTVQAPSDGQEYS